MKKMLKILSLGVASITIFSSSVFASTGAFTSPLTDAFLSVDINGGQNSSQNASTEGTSGPSASPTLSADPYGVTWSPWGGPTSTSGDGTQLPNSSAGVTATSISKTFGSVTATISLDQVNSTHYTGDTLNSRDRGTPSGAAGDGDIFRDFIYAAQSGTIQGVDYLTLQLSGLTAGASYQVALYAFDTTGSHSMNWTAIAPTLESSRDGWWDGTSDGTFTAPTDEQTITWASGGTTPAPAIFTMTANSSGNITLYGFGGNGVTDNQNADTSYLNGFQIAIVPEPSTMALTGAGLVLSALVFRRQKK